MSKQGKKHAVRFADRARNDGQAGQGNEPFAGVVVDLSVIDDSPDGGRSRNLLAVAIDAADGTLVASKSIPADAWDASDFLREVAPIFVSRNLPGSLYVDRGRDWASEACRRTALELGLELNQEPLLQHRVKGLVERQVRAMRARHANGSGQPGDEPLNRSTSPPTT